MPSIYLSPSAQEGNFYVTGPSEEEMMNRLADFVESDLIRAGISDRRNDPAMTVNQIIRDSNADAPDLHLALHSNAAPEGRYGQKRGIVAYYYPGSSEGQRAAETLAENLRRIYPDPFLVRTEATRRLGELRYTRAPAAFLEIGFHDNRADAEWIADNLELIAETITEGVLQYFEDDVERTAVVRTAGGRLNLRAEPSADSEILATIPNSAVLTVTTLQNGWYRTQYLGQAGWVSGEYLQLR